MKHGWEVKKLGEVCEIKPPKKEAKDKLKDTDFVTFLPMEDLGILSKEVTPVQERQLKDVAGSYTYFAENDVLLAKITPCFENGKVGIARNLTNGIGFGSSEYIVFRSKGEVIQDYLFYFLSRESFRQEGKKFMSGAVGHKRVSKEFIDNFLLPYPKLISEQQRIVTILDEAFEAINQAKEKAEQNLKNAKELFESYLQSVFETKGEDWEEKKLGKMVDFLNGYAFKSNDVVDSSNTQLLRMGNLYQNQLNLDRNPVFYSDNIVNSFEKYVLKENDLIISLTGTTNKEDYGFTVRIPKINKTLLLNQRISKILIRDENILSKNFLFYFFLSRVFLDILYSTANGTRQANLSTETMKNLSFYFPNSLSEQQAIVAKLDALSEQTQKLERLYEQKLVDLEELKKSILQKAFNGEL